MVSISLNYPNKSSSTEIENVIGELSREILDTGGNINVVLRYQPLISIGQAEQQKRLVSDLIESSKRNEKSSTKISVIALLISILSIIITIYYSHISNIQDNDWQSSQINLLQKILDK